MRVPPATVVLALALAAAAGAAPPAKLLPAAPVPRLFVAQPEHADVAVTLAVGFLQKAPVETRPYLRFFWFAGVPDGYLERVVTLWRTYLQTISSASALVRPVVVENSGNRLWVLDIRTARWTVDAFRAVAHRDKVFTEPNVSHSLASTVRTLIGLKQDKTYHCEAVVPGAWFLREIMEVEGRSESYYDLLYAVERFGDHGTYASTPEPKKPGYTEWPGGVWRVEDGGDGNFWPKGSRKPPSAAELATYEKAHAEWEKGSRGKGVGGFIDRNFPRDFDDWAAKWGIVDAEKFLARERLYVKNGEVVAGAKDDPRRGSYVAYQNRVIEFLPIATRAAGAVAMRTRDFLAPATGRKNVANFPKEVALGEIEEDLGEQIVTLPNGFQAVMLTGAAKAGRKRAEFGDARAVRSSLDPHDVVIRVAFSCVLCHGPESGIIPPSNRKIRESLERATNLLAKYPDDRDAIESFFVGWEANLEIWRTPLRVGLFAVTASAAEPKGWSGARWAAETLSFRDWYDGPVDLDAASAALGYPRLGVALAALLVGSDTYDATALFAGAGVPRVVWDSDLEPDMALILSYARQVDSGDLLYDFWCAAAMLKGKK